MLRNKLFVVLYIDNRSFVVVQSDFSALAQPQLVLQQSHKLGSPNKTWGQIILAYVLSHTDCTDSTDF